MALADSLLAWHDSRMVSSASNRTRGSGNSDAYKTVGIVGGGTAGYLTALALKKKLPELQISLIESPTIPIIGVGEGTTPIMVKFLHNYLDRNIHEFFKRVQPTLKFGVKFEWGAPGDSFFTYAFHPGHILDSQYHGGDFNDYSLGSMMITNGKVPIVRDQKGAMNSLLENIAFAYHLDNAKFVSYLQEEAKNDGINVIEQNVVQFVPHEDLDDGLAFLVTEDGVEREYDLYVDCTGFRSSIIGETLKSPFVLFDSSLFCDRAVVANVPHAGSIKPYTTAETMNSGWCWNTPSREDDHRGYVFSSNFITDEEAAEEMRLKNPGMGDHRVIKFSTGRRESFWKGNVVAIGNSYGFVEPLESTGLHMIILEINSLILNFPRKKSEKAIAKTINRTLNDHWEDVRWFLAIHYAFNRKLDTPFWEYCRAETDIGDARERVELFQERAPLTYRQSLFYKTEAVFGDFAYDALLLGQGVSARFLEPQEKRAEWQKRNTGLKNLAETCISQAEALALLETAPEHVLQGVVSKPDTWASWP